MERNLEMREAEEGDLDAIVRLHLETIALLAGIAPEGYATTLREPPAADEVRHYFLGILAEAQACFRVAQIDEEFAGYALAVVEEHTDDLIEAPFVTIQFLEVLPEFRGRGVAQSLLAAVEEFARERDIACLDLAVWSRNEPARRLFAKAGFFDLEHRMTKRL
jgi:ribosomal protein S18 acetylase RimI-like enzyme